MPRQPNRATHMARGTRWPILQQHQTDAIETYEEALLDASTIDDAAALLISRLADPKLRSDALMVVQQYDEPPVPPRAQNLARKLARGACASGCEGGDREGWPGRSIRPGFAGRVGLSAGSRRQARPPCGRQNRAFLSPPDPMSDLSDPPSPAAGAAPRGVHLRHRGAGCAGLRHRHPGAAEAGRAVHEREYAEGGGALRRVRGSLGADAVHLVAAAGRGVGSLRSAPGDSHFCFGMGLDYIVMAVAPTVGWLLLGRIASGYLRVQLFDLRRLYRGRDAAGERAAAFECWVRRSAWLCHRPGVRGMLGEIDPRLPFWGAAALSLISGAYGLFVLPESLPPERRSKFLLGAGQSGGARSSCCVRTPSCSISPASTSLFQLRPLRAAQRIRALRRLPLSLDRKGCRLDAGGGGRFQRGGAGWSGAAVRTPLRRSCVDVLRACIRRRRVCLVWAGGEFAVVLGALPAFSLMGLFGPGLQSLMSQRVGADEQGQLQGANNSMMGIAGMIGPILFTQVFAYFIDAQRQPQNPRRADAARRRTAVHCPAAGWNAARKLPPPVLSGDVGSSISH